MTRAPERPDPAKSTYRDQWNVSAESWNRWWRVFEDGAQVVNEVMCDLAHLAPGQHVLDVASGLGEPAFTAARRVGDRGSVLGVDLAPRMVELATQRACANGCTNARFETGDAEDLHVAPESFDVALSRWGIMLLPDPVLGAVNVRRATKPGARFVASVWCGPDDVPFIALPQRLAERLGLAPPFDPNAPGPMRFGRNGQLERCLIDAGFRDVEVRTVPVTMTFASPREYVDFQRDMSGTLKRSLEAAPPDVQAHAWTQLARELAPFTGTDGRVRFENRCFVGVATRPAT